MVNESPATPALHITALILAGGRGERVGGADKGLLLLDDQPLVGHLAATLRTQAHTLLISANRNADRYQAYGRVVADADPGFTGPLAGVLAGLLVCETEWLCCLPCDLVGLPGNAVQQLAACVTGAVDLRAAYAEVDGEALYPLCLLHRGLAAHLQPWLAARPEPAQRALRHWLAAVGAEPAAVGGWAGGGAISRNINTLADLEALQAERATR